PERDRIDDELDLRDAKAGIGSQAFGDLRAAAGQGRDRVLAEVALDPAPPARQANQDRDGPLDLGRIAPDLGTDLVHQPEAWLEARGAVLDVGVPDVPGVDPRQGDPEHPRPDAADQERRSAGSGWTRHQLAVAGLVPATVEI